MNPQILKLLSILLKHSGEVPNIVTKFQAVAAAIATKGAEKVDPICDALNSLKPVEADLISGGFLASHDKDEATLTAEFGKIGDGTLLKKLLDLLNNPALASLLPLILKILGVG